MGSEEENIGVIIRYYNRQKRIGFNRASYWNYLLKNIREIIHIIRIFPKKPC